MELKLLHQLFISAFWAGICNHNCPSCRMNSWSLMISVIIDIFSKDHVLAGRASSY